METKVYVNGAMVCEALSFRVTKGRQNYANVGGFDSPGERIPTLREPDRFELLVPLSAMQLALLPVGLLEVEETGQRFTLLASGSDTASAGHRLRGFVQPR